MFEAIEKEVTRNLKHMENSTRCWRNLKTGGVLSNESLEPLPILQKSHHFKKLT